MQLYLKASSSQRFFAYIIDILLILMATTLCSTFVLSITSFDSEKYNELYDLIKDKLMDYAQNSNVDLIDSIGKDNLKEFIKLLCISYGVNISFYLLFTIIYLVILPYYWEKQTLGRLVANIKVIRHSGDIKCTIKDLIVRELVGTFLLYLVFGWIGLFACISAIVASFSGRSIIDYIAKTDLVMFNPVLVDEEEMKNRQNQMNNFNNYSNNNQDTIDAEVKETKDDNNSSNNDDSEDDYIVI